MEAATAAVIMFFTILILFFIFFSSSSHFCKYDSFISRPHLFRGFFFVPQISDKSLMEQRKAPGNFFLFPQRLCLIGILQDSLMIYNVQNAQLKRALCTILLHDL
jgi:hypothetical protein